MLASNGPFEVKVKASIEHGDLMDASRIPSDDAPAREYEIRIVSMRFGGDMPVLHISTKYHDF
jgi:hypothetical protein